MLGRIFGYKGQEVSGCGREMHKHELNDFAPFIKYY
jgi:hypothetical protein